MRSAHRLLLAFLAGSLVAGCARSERRAGGGTGDYGGTMVLSVAGDADMLFPPLSINNTSAEVSTMVFEYLAQPDKQLNTIGDAGWTGELARSWTWSRDSLSIAFHLDPQAHWHDGVPVRASDVRFTWQLYTDPTVGSNVAPLLGNIDSVTAPDSLTTVFWFKRRYPTQFFDAAFQMRMLPQHVLAGADRAHLASSDYARHPIGSGPYRFVRWIPRQSIELEADSTYHLGRPHLTHLIWSVAPDPNAAELRVLSGDADFIEFLRPQDVEAAAKQPALAVVRYPSLAYGYLLFNLRDPKHSSAPNAVLADVRVRRALAMAVDRRRAVESVYDTLGLVSFGPFTRALSSADTTLPQIPYAPDSARRLLDAAGWRVTGADSIRSKNGRPLRFTILVPNSSTPRVRLAVVMQQMFRSVGARADIEQVDFPTFQQRQDARTFDAAIEAMQSDGNPTTIQQFFSIKAARDPGGQNFGSYESPRFDALLDTAANQMDTARANAYYHRAYQMLIDDAPAIWLFEPVTLAAIAKRIHPVDMRADAWYAHLERWYIPASEQIARDRIGLADPHP